MITIYEVVSDNGEDYEEWFEYRIDMYLSKDNAMRRAEVERMKNKIEGTKAEVRVVRIEVK